MAAEKARSHHGSPHFAARNCCPLSAPLAPGGGSGDSCGSGGCSGDIWAALWLLWEALGRLLAVVDAMRRGTAAPIVNWLLGLSGLVLGLS